MEKILKKKNIRNYRNNINANPGIRLILVFCVGLYLHPVFACDLIKKAGYDFFSKIIEENIAYCYLINNLHMESIKKWNMVLESFDLKLFHN